jgi:hypothetical protein
MATWPSGTKASTANLDAGTDSPSSARADLKQNTDNVNNIIDMFNISTPSDNQILKYNSANSRFELSTDLNTDAVTSVNSQTGAVSLDTDDISEGTNKYFSNTLSRSAISVTDSGGDGALSYNSSTGVITYTGPSATDVRAHFSAGTGITLTDGVIASTVTSGIADVVADTTPQLGGNLDVNGQSIVSVSNGNIVLAPNGTGRVSLDGVLWPASDGSNGQVLQTNGSGSASWVTPSTGAPGAGFAYFRGFTVVQVSGSTYRYTTSVLSANLISLTQSDSNRRFTLPVGTYFVEVAPGASSITNNSGGSAYIVYNVTTDSSEGQWAERDNVVANTWAIFRELGLSFTVTDAAHVYEFRYTAGGTPSVDATPRALKIIKIA